MFDLPGSWVWDFWFADDGDRYHLFFLYASRALRDPDARHYRASIGHAVSTDLVEWTQVSDALVRSDAPSFDDLATWTGSVIRHPDGTYTWRRSQGEPILDDKGNVKEWLGLNVDVEQRTANASRPQLNRITGAQIRAARGLLKWSVMDLAEQSGVSRATIRRLEEIDGPPPQQERALTLIESALSRAGIDLLFPEVGKPGIRPR